MFIQVTHDEQGTLMSVAVDAIVAVHPRGAIDADLPEGAKCAIGHGDVLCYWVREDYLTVMALIQKAVEQERAEFCRCLASSLAIVARDHVCT